MHPPTTVRALRPWHCCAATMLVAAAAMVALVPPAEAAAKQAVVLEIDGAIGPANADYLVRELRAAKPGTSPGGAATAPRPGRPPRVFLSSQLRDCGGVLLPRTPQSATAQLGRFGL